MDFETARANMIQQQIRPWDVLDTQILEILQNTPREAFMPEAYQQLAFCDTEIPLDHGQHTLNPKVEGRILQALQIQTHEQVLEIGTGCGYLTAVAAQLAQQVVSLEIHAELHTQTKATLAHHSSGNIELRHEDVFAALPTAASFDVIMITGAMAEENPVFKQALKIGGRLFQVIGQSPIMQAVLIRREDEQRFDSQVLFETRIDYLLGAEPQPEFSF